jgi:hypothetical protein
MLIGISVSEDRNMMKKEPGMFQSRMTLRGEIQRMHNVRKIT